MLNFFSDGLNLKQTAVSVNGVEGVFTGRIFPILKLQKFMNNAYYPLTIKRFPSKLR